MSDYKSILKNIKHLDKNIKIAFVCGDFNKHFVSEVSDITEDFFKNQGFENIATFSVPGALEIPAMVKRVLKQEDYDLVCCFGVVVRGATTHYETVCNESARAIMDLSLKYYKTAIINGIITCENEEQVKERIGNNYAIFGLNLLAEIKKLG